MLHFNLKYRHVDQVICIIINMHRNVIFVQMRRNVHILMFLLLITLHGILYKCPLMRQLLNSTITYESTLPPQSSVKLLIKVTDETTLFFSG